MKDPTTNTIVRDGRRISFLKANLFSNGESIGLSFARRSLLLSSWIWLSTARRSSSTGSSLNFGWEITSGKLSRPVIKSTQREHLIIATERSVKVAKSTDMRQAFFGDTIPGDDLHCFEMAGLPRSTYFWTLPVAVFGNSARNVMPWGALKCAR